MVAPAVASVMVTLCADVYVPAAGVNTGIAAAVGVGGGGVDELLDEPPPQAMSDKVKRAAAATTVIVPVRRLPNAL